eukprot:Sspe_Gene.44540::Locus_21852_Transcript_1_1_Confidence_1.000_Length_2521::g.44540::m.44540
MTATSPISIPRSHSGLRDDDDDDDETAPLLRDSYEGLCVGSGGGAASPIAVDSVETTGSHDGGAAMAIGLGRHHAATSSSSSSSSSYSSPSGSNSSPPTLMKRQPYRLLCPPGMMWSVHAIPSPAATILRQVEDGADIVVLERRNGWLRLADGSGWVMEEDGGYPCDTEEYPPRPVMCSGRWVPLPAASTPEGGEEVICNSAPAVHSSLATTEPRYTLHIPVDDPRRRAHYRLSQDLDGTRSLSALDLATPFAINGDPSLLPMLKPSIPVQRTTAYTHRRGTGHDDRGPQYHDYLWIFGASRERVESNILPVAKWWPLLVKDEGDPIELGSLLWAWMCVLAGILSMSIGESKLKSISDDHAIDRMLLKGWVTMAASVVFIIPATVLLAAQCVRGDFTGWGGLANRYSLTLVLLATLAYALNEAALLMSYRYAPDNVAVFFFSFHSAAVLAVRIAADLPSGTGQKFGVATVLLGAACCGLSDFFGPDHKSVKADELSVGAALSFTAALLLAAFLVLAKYTRLGRPGYEVPLAPYLTLMCFWNVLLMTSLTLAFGRHGKLSFDDDSTTGILGGVHIAKDIAIITILDVIGLAGLTSGLRVLPSIIISAVFGMRPVLTFLSSLAVQSSLEPTPLPTLSVGSLFILVGCICVCRSSVTQVVIKEELMQPSSQHLLPPGPPWLPQSYTYDQLALAMSHCPTCNTQGPHQCPIHGPDFVEATYADSAIRHPPTTPYDNEVRPKHHRKKHRESASSSSPHHRHHHHHHHHRRVTPPPISAALPAPAPPPEQEPTPRFLHVISECE